MMFRKIIILYFNPLNTKLNPICHLLALLGAHHILHVSRIRVKNQLKLANSKQGKCSADINSNGCLLTPKL